MPLFYPPQIRHWYIRVTTTHNNNNRSKLSSGCVLDAGPTTCYRGRKSSQNGTFVVKSGQTDVTPNKTLRSEHERFEMRANVV